MKLLHLMIKCSAREETYTFSESLFFFILESINDGEGNANTSTISLGEELEDPSIICCCTSVFNTIVPILRTPPTPQPSREAGQMFPCRPSTIVSYSILRLFDPSGSAGK